MPTEENLAKRLASFGWQFASQEHRDQFGGACPDKLQYAYLIDEQPEPIPTPMNWLGLKTLGEIDVYLSLYENLRSAAQKRAIACNRKPPVWAMTR